MSTLAGANALVVGGGGGGIGRAITRRLAAAGAAVAVADVDPGRADEAAGEIAAAGARSVALAGDVRSAEEVDRLVDAAAEQLGSLDVVVTVVGGQLAFVQAARLHEIAEEDWRLIFDVNLHYVARTARTAIRRFLEQGRGGSIVSVGSITGQVGSPQQATTARPRPGSRAWPARWPPSTAATGSA